MNTLAAQFAAAIGVNPKTPHAFDLRRPCFSKLYDVIYEGICDGLLVNNCEGRFRTTFQAVMAASTVVHNQSQDFNKMWNAAHGLSRSINTARLCPVASMRVQAYKPYRLCQLLARIVAECPTLTSAEVDNWLRAHKSEL